LFENAAPKFLFPRDDWIVSEDGFLQSSVAGTAHGPGSALRVRSSGVKPRDAKAEVKEVKDGEQTPPQEEQR